MPGALHRSLAAPSPLATWIVDRGLVERREAPSDRRRRDIVLTDEGARRRAALLDAMYEPPAQLRDLDDQRLHTLAAALRDAATGVANGVSS